MIRLKYILGFLVVMGLLASCTKDSFVYDDLGCEQMDDNNKDLKLATSDETTSGESEDTDSGGLSNSDDVEITDDDDDDDDNDITDDDDDDDDKETGTVKLIISQ
jgi:hypothetical protein